MAIRFLGANLAASLKGMDQLPGKHNYLPRGDPASWRTNIPTYGKVAYGGLYDGVDLSFYGNPDRLECDFDIDAGNDPAQIKLALDGAERTTTDHDGNLLLTVKGKTIRFLKPVAYQAESDNSRRRVDVAYRVAATGRAKGNERVLSFVVGKYRLGDKLCEQQCWLCRICDPAFGDCIGEPDEHRLRQYEGGFYLGLHSGEAHQQWVGRYVWSIAQHQGHELFVVFPAVEPSGVRNDAAAGASCTFDAAFEPTVAGPLTASVQIADSASNSPQTVALSGTGVGTTTASVSPTSISFANTKVGSISAYIEATLTNNGTAAMTGVALSITGANASSFFLPSTHQECGTTLAAGASCTFDAAFEPTTGGAPRRLSIDHGQRHKLAADGSPFRNRDWFDHRFGQPNHHCFRRYKGRLYFGLYFSHAHQQWDFASDRSCFQCDRREYVFVLPAFGPPGMYSNACRRRKLHLRCRIQADYHRCSFCVGPNNRRRNKLTPKHRPYGEWKLAQCKRT